MRRFEFTRVTVSMALAILLLASALPASGQGLVEYNVEFMPLPNGYHASTARGISDGDWDPPIIVGTVENSPCKASCWIRVAQQWTAHVLPGLDPNMDSWSNGVMHVPAALGQWTVVAGASRDGSGAQKPMIWDSVDNTVWNAVPLPTLNGGEGEAHAIFKPDGTPLRALMCGWADETPPMAAGDAPGARRTGLRVPTIWETRSTGERIMQPEFGAGRAGIGLDIGALERIEPTPGQKDYVAVGGGQSASGGWMPQMWTSSDDGETWVNEELPLPITATSGEATGFDFDGENTLFVAGWGQSATGMTTPLVWERDVDDPLGMWIIHELPLPVGANVGQGGAVRKKPGRLKYSNITIKAGIAEMTLWVDDGSGWTALAPADYLVDPQAGTPVSPGAQNGKFDAIATTTVQTSSFGASPAALDTLAAVLVPTSLTGVGPRPAPQLVALSASPNPFNPGVRIGYTLPREARVTVTIYDAKGGVVARFDEGVVAAGAEHAVFWNGDLSSGHRAASGVYFVRVATPREVATVKIVRVE